MVWLKRNLFLVIFGVIALGLLGYAGFYFWTNRTANKELETKLEETKAQLEQLYRKNPFPSETNIATARNELARVRQVVNVAQQFYQPIPFEKVADKDFRAVLDNTVFDLQERARQIGVELPEKDYAFSFKAQKTLLTFAPGSFPTLPEQLAEIKTICGLLFDAKINRLANVKRMRVTVDDPAGAADYHDQQTVTNDVTKTVSNPYEVTFHSFSAEIAQALEGFYKSPHGMIVKTLAVKPAPEAPNRPGAAPPPRPNVIPPPGGPIRPNVPPGAPGAVPPAVAPVPMQPRPARPGQKEVLKTVLNEKLLEATVLIEIIKPIQ
jgi:hypothetical protein